MRKATRGHPLSEAQQQTNHTITRMRVMVEHIFARMAQTGGRLVSEHRFKTSHAAQPPQQSGLQHGSLCLLGPLRRAERRKRRRTGKKEDKTSLKPHSKAR